MSAKLSVFAVFGYASTHDALAAESLLEDMGVSVVPIPAPKSLGQLCGIALRIPAEEAERARDLLERADLAPSAMSEIEDR